MSDESEGYLVVVKPSALKASGAVGEWVNRNGPTRRFASKPLAREWARDCAGPGSFVWIQDAVPWDRSGVDGYLVGGTRRPTVEERAGTQARLGEES